MNLPARHGRQPMMRLETYFKAAFIAQALIAVMIVLGWLAQHAGR